MIRRRLAALIQDGVALSKSSATSALAPTGRISFGGRPGPCQSAAAILARRSYCSSRSLHKDVKMTWHVLGEDIEVTAPEGKTLLEVAHENDIELEGACGGELACSTCHVVFDKELYDKLPEKKEEEEDMLDLAWGLTDTSRLGCQIKVTPLLEGATITIPEETNNMLDSPPPK